MGTVPGKRPGRNPAQIRDRPGGHRPADPPARQHGRPAEAARRPVVRIRPGRDHLEAGRHLPAADLHEAPVRQPGGLRPGRDGDGRELAGRDRVSVRAADGHVPVQLGQPRSRGAAAHDPDRVHGRAGALEHLRAARLRADQADLPGTRGARGAGRDRGRRPVGERELLDHHRHLPDRAAADRVRRLLAHQHRHHDRALARAGDPPAHGRRRHHGGQLLGHLHHLLPAPVGAAGHDRAARQHARPAADAALLAAADACRRRALGAQPGRPGAGAAADLRHAARAQRPARHLLRGEQDRARDHAGRDRVPDGVDPVRQPDPGRRRRQEDLPRGAHLLVDADGVGGGHHHRALDAVHPPDDGSAMVGGGAGGAAADVRLRAVRRLLHPEHRGQPLQADTLHARRHRHRGGGQHRAQLLHDSQVGHPRSRVVDGDRVRRPGGHGVAQRAAQLPRVVRLQPRAAGGGAGRGVHGHRGRAGASHPRRRPCPAGRVGRPLPVRPHGHRRVHSGRAQAHDLAGEANPLWDGPAAALPWGDGRVAFIGTGGGRRSRAGGGCAARARHRRPADPRGAGRPGRLGPHRDHPHRARPDAGRPARRVLGTRGGRLAAGARDCSAMSRAAAAGGWAGG